MGGRLVWVALGVLCASPASAEEYVPFRPVTSGPFVTFTAPITLKGKLLAQPIVSLAFAHASLDATGRPVANGPSDGLRSAALTVFAEYGFDDDTAFGAQLAAIHNDRLGASSS